MKPKTAAVLFLFWCFGALVSLGVTGLIIWALVKFVTS